MSRVQGMGHAHRMGLAFATRIMTAMTAIFSSIAPGGGLESAAFALAMMASTERIVKLMSARTAEFSTILARWSRFAQGMGCALPIGDACATRVPDGTAL